MKLSPDALIVTAKLTKYLLVWRDADDKSKFLAQAGYGQENWQQLEADLRSQLLPLEAVRVMSQINLGMFTRFEVV